MIPVLERIYPDRPVGENDRLTIQLHLDRYHFAGQNLKKGIIADIACGSGYGSFLLAEHYPGSIKRIISVDNSIQALEYAIKHYRHPLIDYAEHDAVSFQPNCLLDTVISLETIEHLPDPGKFIQNLASNLTTGGRFIASAPITPSMDANPYHLHDFTIKSFKNLFIQEGLTEINSFIQVQKYKPLKLIGRKKGRIADIRRNILLYYLKHPGKFLLRLRSLVRDGFRNKYLVVVFEKI